MRGRGGLREARGAPPCWVSDLAIWSLGLCSQRCCHCCLLGRAAQAQGQSCEYNLMVGYQCGLVFRACCVKGQETTDFAPADNGDLQETGDVPLPFGLGQCISQGYPDKQDPKGGCVCTRVWREREID